jgi:pyrroloquinoline quinone (PQQ) biosynthesis protein C
VLTQPRSIGDQREADEADEQCVELVEAREDAPKALDTILRSMD